mgnify:CR=1 FL=1
MSMYVFVLTKPSSFGHRNEADRSAPEAGVGMAGNRTTLLWDDGSVKIHVVSNFATIGPDVFSKKLDISFDFIPLSCVKKKKNKEEKKKMVSGVPAP